MAVNALGLPLQLQASPQQLQDLLAGLKPGDQVRGRLVDLLPEGKAVLNLRGQNLVAQLPQGPALPKGSVLDLQVTQLAPPDAGKAASLTLRLLATAPAGQASAPAPTPGGPAGAPQGAPPPPQVVLDQAVSAARLPLNPISQQAARTLAQLGVPLTPQALQQAVRATEGLLAAEQAPRPAQPGLPQPVQQSLQQAAQELRLAVQLSRPGETALQLQQAMRAVEQALWPALPASSAPSTLATPPPAAPATPTPPTLVQFAAPATMPPQAPMPAQPQAQVQTQAIQQPQAQAQAIQQAVAQVLAQPQAAPVQALQSLLQSLQPMPAPAPLPSQASQPQAGPRPSQAAPAPAPASVLPASPAPMPALQLFQREAVAPLLALAAQSEPPSAQNLAQATANLVQALQDPASPPAQRLVQAVQVQYPQAQPAAILQTGREALALFQAQVQSHLHLQIQTPPQAQAPIPMTLAQVQTLADQAGLSAPRVPLQSLPVEVVAEAVTWLQARDLPPQRPLVEAVAVFLQQDHNALPAAQRALALAQTLPEPLLAQRPGLQQAITQAQTALQQASLSPDQPGLAARLQAWAGRQGLDLEAALLRQALTRPGNSPAPAPAPTPAPPTPIQAPAAQPPLRSAFQQLEQQLRAALPEPLAQEPATAGRLQAALGEAQSANRAFSALPLQSQAAPAYDTVHMPLPVALGADLGGQLSVTWRQGRERTLDDKEPVSVAVALNTGALGKVKVLMQVWKGSVSARVLAEDADTAGFLARGAEELRQGFNERTPFKLQALDFGVDTGRPAPVPSPPASGRPGGWSA